MRRGNRRRAVDRPAAAFLARDEFQDKTIFPPVLEGDYWRDKEAGFAGPRYLGEREMDTD